ncbi:MAG: bifunctional phosphopantothenoylcysteine decarboxylase/phosphopantothenate--cysteine ligase CoaBC [Acidimicrobiia bacterium]
MGIALMLRGRHVVLGVSGGVAGYKAAYLARRLVEAGAEVRTVMTESATRFVGAQTLAAITGTAPVVGLFGAEDVSPHTTLARWADVVVVAPATAATLSRVAMGLAEDALSATVLAAWGKPVVLAPAMHTEMWEHPATRRTVATLTSDGYRMVGPETGALAGGDQGPGRLAEPEDIVSAIDRALGGGDLTGWRVLVSAGGTREAIDPVRFIGNRSSGRMGNAIALAAAERGAAVTLVTTMAPAEHPDIAVLAVETADEMATAVWKTAEDADVVVLAAAVADFRPAEPSTGKLRRTDGPPEIALEPTPDILAGVARMQRRPFLVGFAAETGSLDEAVAKAERKGVDLLVGNDVSDPGSGFGTDTNQVAVITPDGATDRWPLLTKREVADRLWDRIAAMRGIAP